MKRRLRHRDRALTPRVRGWFVTTSSDFRPRRLWLLGAFSAMAIILLARCIDVQIIQGPSLAAQAAAQHVESIETLGHRGRILDRYGDVLASDETVYDIFGDPGLIADADRPQVAESVASILNLPVATVLADLQDQTRFVYLAHGVNASVEQQINALGMEGIGVIPSEKRVYASSPLPNASFAANLLGFVDADGNGQYGVEQNYNAVLKGQNGTQTTLRDVAGNPIELSGGTQTPATDGSDLRLGLDSELQYDAEQALAQEIKASGAASGTVMVMDTSTGSIRAWVDEPTYNANDYQAANVANFYDPAVSQPYEPGSIFKLVTFASGLENHAITPGYTFNEGPTNVQGYTISDWDDGSFPACPPSQGEYRRCTMQQVLDESLNNGAIKVEQLEGENDFYNGMLAMGIGQYTGVDLAGEDNYPLPPQSQWQALNYATASFGQSVFVTPVQMLTAVNAIANGGVMVTPHAVDAIINPTTGQETPVEPQTKRVLPQATANTLLHMMVGVVDDPLGSGFAARIPEFKGEIAGKTGTASVAIGGKYVEGNLICSFAEVMPANNPAFTMMVILRDPTGVPLGTREGAYLAAPVAQKLTLLLADMWKIKP